MEPIAFPEKNDVLTAPQGKTKNISTLPIYRGDNHGMPIISCWKLSPEELEEVQKTGVIWLWVMAPTTYPVSLSGISPFKPVDADHSGDIEE